jgi:hypothetical protein
MATVGRTAEFRRCRRIGREGWEWDMGLFSRSGGRTSRGGSNPVDGWIADRRGVEIYVEPRTAVTGLTMLLVAADGEFIRRPVDSPKKAQAFARRHGLPIYDATVVGYPQRMRDWSRRRTLLARREQQRLLDS